ncbi:ribbon-helix-helix domain-containing protein [Ancylobacter mangrovi]|uniref:ribbon-helix-helix domain-containing protein n=1 Tax=Ancylobacter mangrovi TaxID=2972472 RepID=UPI0021628DBE|nr:ribbon-helix-helix domain-containing protein [Ancylobacter mangrovi]MCS0504088.1 ribbon-helix-helix domain-containing protein [Ancylobacter mangrovi]
MCRIFAGQAPDTYESQTRSVRVGGHTTSIRLEAAFWNVLEELAAHQGMSLGKFVSHLHDEVLQLHGEVRNFASLLRCCCLIYRGDIQAAAVGPVAPGRLAQAGAQASLAAAE